MGVAVERLGDCGGLFEGVGGIIEPVGGWEGDREEDGAQGKSKASGGEIHFPG